MTNEDFMAAIAKATTPDEMFCIIEERQIARFPELAEAIDREFVANQIIAEATSEECAEAAQVMALGPWGSHPDDARPSDGECARHDAAASFTVKVRSEAIAFAAQILMDHAVRKAGAEHTARILDWRGRGDEALAEYLLYKLNDHDGFITLTVGGPPGFNARRYFLDRVKLVGSRRRWAATAKAKAKAKESAEPEAAALRRANDNLRKARRRVKLAADRVAQVEKRIAEEDPHYSKTLMALEDNPLQQAKDRLAEAERLYRKYETATQAARA